MKKIALSILALLTGNIAISQIIDYNYLFDDPKFFLHVKGGAFSDLDIFANQNYRGGIYTGLEINLGNRMYVSGDMKLGLESWRTKMTEKAANEINSNMVDISGRFSFNFSYQETSPKYRVTLKKDVSSTRTTTTTYTTTIDVPAKRIDIFGLTGSAGYYNNSFIQGNREIFSTNEMGNIDNLAMRQGGVYVSGGLQYRRYRNFAIDGKNRETGEAYKKKGDSEHRNVMLEVVYMPSIGLSEEFLMPDGSVLTLAERPSVRNIGFRVISDVNTLAQFGPVGLGGRLEAGTRPGVVMPVNKSQTEGFSWYIMAGLYLSFNK